MRPCCERYLGLGDQRVTARFISLLKLYARLQDVQGCIVELGVASGESIRTWAHFAEFHPGHVRRVYGFDTFAGFPVIGGEDGPLIPAIGKRVGGETDLRPRPLGLREVNVPPQIYLVEGDIVETLPKYAFYGSQLALVYFDADLYAPTKCGLDVLWPRLAPGGLFVFDEYGQEAWPGETKAVDDFLSTHVELKLERLTMESGPTACVVKP